MAKLFFLQTATDLKSVISMNDATIIGILIAVIISLVYVVRHVYFKLEEKHKEYIEELRANNKTMIDVSEKYSQAMNNSTEAYRNLTDLLKNKK